MGPTLSHALLGAFAFLGACSTASLVEVHSLPEGAEIWVQGVATGRTCPTTIDLEAYAVDPDRPMTVEVRLAGHGPTVAPPYPPRHRCGQLVCEHKRRTYLPYWLPLYAEGTGVRVDTRREGYEVSVDEGSWIAVDGLPTTPRATFGVTVATAPGDRVFRWRPRSEAARRSFPEQTATLRIPPQGYVAVDFDLSTIYQLSTPTLVDAARR